MEIYRLAICADCLSFAANGEWTDEDGDVHKTAPNGWPGINEGYTVEPGEWQHSECDHDETSDCPEDEGHFSWWQCDACHSPLGGMRYPAAMVKR